MRALALLAVLSLSTGCAGTIAFGDSAALLCHDADGGTLSNNAVEAIRQGVEAGVKAALPVPIP